MKKMLQKPKTKVAFLPKTKVFEKQFMLHPSNQDIGFRRWNKVWEKSKDTKIFKSLTFLAQDTEMTYLTWQGLSGTSVCDVGPVSSTDLS